MMVYSLSLSLSLVPFGTPVSAFPLPDSKRTIFTTATSVTLADPTLSCCCHLLLQYGSLLEPLDTNV